MCGARMSGGGAPWRNGTFHYPLVRQRFRFSSSSHPPPSPFHSAVLPPPPCSISTASQSASEHERCEWRRQWGRLLSPPTAATTVAAPGSFFAIDAALVVDEADGKEIRHGRGGGSGGGNGCDRPFMRLGAAGAASRSRTRRVRVHKPRPRPLKR